ncbi:alpha-L-fucosidase [Pontibacter sp. E15-1]|uniref:alpha-L-fucosidase n=1 Tax=Pontibacter sp. E15-1 TaxID=2919918 RepID=UPI001F50219F|nr:alpha-L-fucosidase [Pontibacter sp. E15-1]MCJ8164389.1 alpha-L-fucosidase [Pontibacter sp. E15-1]
MIRLLGLSLLVALVAGNASAQQYEPNWASLDKRETPTWWTDAKFGIFIHWGPYAVPAYAPVNEVEEVDEHMLPQFKDLVTRFKPERYSQSRESAAAGHEGGGPVIHLERKTHAHTTCPEPGEYTLRPCLGV